MAKKPKSKEQLTELSEPLKMAIAGRLKLARQAAGWKTAKSFSDAIGVPQPTYSSHEKGTRAIDIATAVIYSDALRNCDWEWIITGYGRGPAGENIPDRIYTPASDGAQSIPRFDSELLAYTIGQLEKLPPRKRLEKLPLKVRANLLRFAYEYFLEWKKSPQIERDKQNIKVHLQAFEAFLNAGD